MDERRTVSQTRIDGRAVFACAAYLIGVGLIFLLERIGAPAGLVRVLGPILALGAVSLIGPLLRTARIAAFYVADHAGAPRYGAVAFAAIAASLIFCADQDKTGAAPPIVPLAIGFAFAALVVGPLARGAGASSLRDAVVARFNSRPLRAALGLAFFAIGVLIAASGYEIAARTMASLLGLSQHGAIAAVGVILALIIAPGGLAGLYWIAAAAAGITGLVLVLPILLRVAADASIGAPLLGGGAEIAASLARALTPLHGGSPEGGLGAVAIALGAAALPPLSTGAFASFTPQEARRAGLGGVALAASFGLALALGGPLWPAFDSVAADSLRASAALIAALICAAAGVHTGSRAVSAEAAYGYESVLASARLARSRGLALLSIALAAALAMRHEIEPAEALVFASALSLGILVPPLLLAVSTRSRAAHAIAAVAASLAMIAALIWMNGWAALLRQAPVFALTGAAAGFVVGWAASLFGGAPTQAEPPAQMFIEEPFDS
jgi:Na+/proline symporter